MMDAKDLHYYIESKIREKSAAEPGDAALVKEKLHHYKRRGSGFKRSALRRPPATGLQEIVRVRGETEELQKSITLLQRGVHGIERYRETLQCLLHCLQSSATAPPPPETIRSLLRELDQTAKDVEQGLLSSAFAPQRRTQHVLVRERGSATRHPLEVIKTGKETFDTLSAYILDERFGRDRTGAVLDVIKVDSVRMVRNFFTAGGLEETREYFPLAHGNHFRLKRNPKPGSEIVTLDSRVLPRAKTGVPDRPSYTIENGLLTLCGLADDHDRGQAAIEFWTDTPLDRFHLTQCPAKEDSIAAVTVRNRPVPNNSENGWSLEGNVIVLRGTWIPEQGDDVQVTFEAGIQVRHLDVRSDIPESGVEVEINGSLLPGEQVTVQPGRLIFPRSVRPRHGDLVIVREAMDPDISILELSREPVPGSVRAVLQSAAHLERQLPISHTGRTVLLREAVNLERGACIRVSYSISEPTRRLELRHVPVPATLSVTMIPDKPGPGRKQIKGLAVRGTTVPLPDFLVTGLPGEFLVEYQWKDEPARLQCPELPLAHAGRLTVPLDKPLVNPEKLSVTVNGTAVPKHRLNGYRLSRNRIVLSGVHAPHPGDEIIITYEFGRTAEPLYAGSRIIMGKEAELPIDLSLTGVNLDTLGLGSTAGRKRAVHTMKWLSTWLLQKETKIQTQLTRAEMTLTGLMRRQDALAKRTFRAASSPRRQPEVFEQTRRALSRKNRIFLGKVASLKPFSAGVLLDEETYPWSAVLQEQQTISAYC